MHYADLSTAISEISSGLDETFNYRP